MNKVRAKITNSVLLLVKIFLCVSLFLACFGKSTNELVDLITNIEKRGYVLLFVWIYLLIGGLIYYFRKQILGMETKKYILFIFVFAMLFRIPILFVERYSPFSDFYQYYIMGVNIVEGNAGLTGYIVKMYGTEKMGGLSVLSAIVAKLFSTKLIGYLFCNCLLTSLESCIIYLISKKIDVRISVISSLIWALYPGNIIATHITTNHHGAVLFTLLAMFFYLLAYDRKDYKRWGLLILSGVTLALSDLSHPSVIISVLAIIGFSIFNCMSDNNKKELIVNMIISVISYVLFVNMFLWGIRQTPIIPEMSNSNLNLAKIVVGLNPDTRGGYSGEDYGAILALPVEEQSDYCIEIIKNRVKQYGIFGIAKLFSDKIDYVWAGKDSYFWWYSHKWNDEKETQYIEGVIDEEDINKVREEQLVYDSFSNFDFMYVRVLLLLSLASVLFIRISKNNVSYQLVLWNVAGWIAIHLFIEVQPRYRHLGMPYVVILASVGVVFIYDKYLLVKEKKKSK